jgi:integrase/recombinase XerD
MARTQDSGTRGDRRSSFGSVFRRKRADGTYYPGWWIRYVAGGKRTMQFGGDSKTQAQEFLAARRTEHVNDRILGVANVERVTVAEFIDSALVTYRANLRAGGMGSRATTLKHFRQQFGTVNLCDVTAKDVKGFMDRAAGDGYAKSSIRTMHGHLSSLFKLAMLQRKARENPCRDVRPPKADESDRPYVAPDRLTRIYAAIPAADGYRAAAILCGDAGMRRNEAVYIQWFDFSRPGFERVTIPAERAKSHKARTIKLTARAVAALEELAAGRSTVPFRSDERVFAFDEHKFRSVFRGAMTRIGEEHLTPHMLRHAFAARLVHEGVKIPTVSKLLGHADIKTTMRYAKWAPDTAEDDAIDRFARADQRAAPTSAVSG